MLLVLLFKHVLVNIGSKTKLISLWHKSNKKKYGDKIWVHSRQSSNSVESEWFTFEEWHNIPKGICKKLLTKYKKAINQKGIALTIS